MFSRVNNVDLHLGVKLEARQKLRGDEEVLARARLAGDVDHALVDHAFVAGVHALVDFVDDAEGGAREVLQGHEVEDGGDGALAAGLPVRVEHGEGFAFAAGCC